MCDIQGILLSKRLCVLFNCELPQATFERSPIAAQWLTCSIDQQAMADNEELDALQQPVTAGRANTMDSESSSSSSSDDEAGGKGAGDLPKEAVYKLMGLEAELEQNINLYDKHIEVRCSWACVCEEMAGLLPRLQKI